MNAARHATLTLGLVASLALAASAFAQDAAPANLPAEPAVAEVIAPAPAATTPAQGMGMGMGPGMGMRHGAPHGEHCQPRMHMKGAAKPGMHGGHSCSCRMAGGGMADPRIDELEKRLDLMQAALEMLLRQQAAGE
jgi:hypothetical protein